MKLSMTISFMAKNVNFYKTDSQMAFVTKLMPSQRLIYNNRKGLAGLFSTCHEPWICPDTFAMLHDKSLGKNRSTEI